MGGGDPAARAKWDAIKASVEDVHRHHRKDLYALGEQALPALSDPSLPGKLGYSDWPSALVAEVKDIPAEDVQKAVLLFRLVTEGGCDKPSDGNPEYMAIEVPRADGKSDFIPFPQCSLEQLEAALQLATKPTGSPPKPPPPAPQPQPPLPKPAPPPPAPPPRPAPPPEPPPPPPAPQPQPPSPPPKPAPPSEPPRPAPPPPPPPAPPPKVEPPSSSSQPAAGTSAPSGGRGLPIGPWQTGLIAVAIVAGIIWLSRSPKPAPAPWVPPVVAPYPPTAAPALDAGHRVRRRASVRAPIAIAPDAAAVDAGTRVYYDPHELEFLKELDREEEDPE